METKSEIVKTNCLHCPEECGLQVHIENGRITKVRGAPEHLSSKGRLCPKATAIPDWVYSPDRILHPLKRENGDFKQISWDEALDIIAGKLKGIKKEYGAEAVAVLLGRAVLEQGHASREVVSRWCDVFGTPNEFNVDCLCYKSRCIGQLITTGKIRQMDVKNSKYLLVWGGNNRKSLPESFRDMEDARKNGAKMVVVDPRTPYQAKEADIHVQARPGTDCALALGLLNVIISEDLYDKDFVENWTVGFEKLAERVKSYPPEEVEKITWVPAQTIRQIARDFATIKPACNHFGGTALDQQPCGVAIYRALTIMQGITGNIDVAGGFVFGEDPPMNYLRMPDMVKATPLELDKYPLNTRIHGRWIPYIQGAMVWDTMLTGQPYPIKALISIGCNPVLTFPNSTKVTEAMSKLDFVVQMDHFLSETAQYADIVLPSATFMERTEISQYIKQSAIHYLALTQKVIEPPGECLSDIDIMLRLARKMGYEEYFPWEDEVEVLEFIMEPFGMTVNKLKEEYPDGWFHGKHEMGLYKKEGFPTTSGKLEIYSEEMEKHGYDSIPEHIEPPESPVSTPELARDYPLILTHGAREPAYIHSSLRHIQKLRKILPEPMVDIHPDTAAEYGIKDGEMSVVETKRGGIEIKVRTTPDIVAGVVSIPHGWAEANVNLLTDNQCTDPVSGFPCKSQLCRIRKT